MRRGWRGTSRRPPSPADRRGARAGPLCLRLLLLLAVAGGCGRAEEETAPLPLPRREPGPVRVSGDPWVITAAGLSDDYRGAYLGNGRLGQRVGATGTLPPAEDGGAYLAGFYEHEVLRKLPPLLTLTVRSGESIFGVTREATRDYRQELDLRRAILTTRGRLETPSGPVHVEIRSAFLRSGSRDALVVARVENRSRDTIRIGVGEAEAVVGEARGVTVRRNFFREDTGPDSAEGDVLALAPGETGSFVEAVAVSVGRTAAAGGGPGPPPSLPPAEELLDAHGEAWSRLWKRDIEIEGDPEAQQVVRSCLYQLLSSCRGDGAAGVPPMGLSDGAFNGHVFWDQECWILPALLPLHPEACRPMLAYRLRTLDGARSNARAEGLRGASFAWESAATGRETIVREEFKHGRHVTGGVALAMRHYFAATRDHRWLGAVAWPVLKETADNWTARAKPSRDGVGFGPVTTPDELAGLVDRSAWTEHVARVNLEFAAEAARLLGRIPDPRWERLARKIRYERMPGTGLIRAHSKFTERSKSKQADVLLMFHPGVERWEAKTAGELYDYYAPRVIRNGPAMTNAIHAIVAARLGRDAEALEQFREGYRRFVRPPFQMFSEKATRDNLCFLTGAAGTVEAVLYGFAGLRLQPDPGHPGRPLLDPRLPPGWTRLSLRSLNWRGRRWDVELRPRTPPRWREN